MTVSSDVSRWDYTGNGVLVTYPFTAEIYVKTDLKVYVSGVLKTVDVDYTISAASIENPAGGNVVFTAAPALSAPIAIVLNLPMTQLIDYVEGDKFPAETHERALDRLVKLIQYLKGKFSHVAKLGDDSAIELVMPNPVADNFIGWNAAATNLENKANPVALTTATQWEVDALVTYGGGTAYTKATIDAALTAIGTVNPTTLLLRPGNWTITANADYSTYKNVTFKIPNGSYFTITALMTLTLPSPANIEAQPNQQIFSGAGTVAFSIAGTVYPEWWGANTTPGTTDMTAEINAAIDSVTGADVVLQPTTYLISTTIALDKDYTTLRCPSAYAIVTTASDIDAITVTKLYCKVENVKCITTHVAPTGAGLVLNDGAKICRFYNMWVASFAYGYELNDSGASGILYNDFYGCRSSGIISTCIYVTNSAGAVNENHWFGGNHSATSPGILVNIANGGGASLPNQNTFQNVSFESGNASLFNFIDHGTNTWIGCRFEVLGHCFYIHNDSANQLTGTRIFHNHYSLANDKVPIALMEGRLQTSFWFNSQAVSGYVIEGKSSDTTVNQNSASGTDELYVASTTGMYIGSAIIIDEGGADEEWHTIKAVTDGVSVTLWGNLANTHSAVDAHTVYQYGSFSGQVPYIDSNYYKVGFFCFGERVFDINSSTNCIDIKSGYTLKVAATQVVGAQQTGISAMTNVTAPASWDADAVTTAQLADIVGTLITKLRAHGLVAD